MIWAVAALLFGVVLCVAALRARTSRGPASARATPPFRSGRARAKSWHSVQRTGTGDLWMLGAAAALIAERHHDDRMLAAMRLETSEQSDGGAPGCVADDAQHRDDGTWSDPADWAHESSAHDADGGHDSGD